MAGMEKTERRARVDMRKEKRSRGGEPEGGEEEKASAGMLQ